MFPIHFHSSVALVKIPLEDRQETGNAIIKSHVHNEFQDFYDLRLCFHDNVVNFRLLLGTSLRLL